MLYLIFVIITVIWLVFASLFDLKTREVPNWLNFSLISIGLGGRLIYSFITFNFMYFFYGLIGFGIFFVISNFMYYTRQWGGGDGKLLMGIGAMFGDYKTVFNERLIFPFLAEFVINLAVFGSVLGLLWSFYLAVKNKDKFLGYVKRTNLKLVSVLLIILVVLSSVPMFFVMEAAIFIFMLPVLALILIFIQIVDKSCMYRHLKVNEIREGEWVCEDVLVKGKLIVSKSTSGITNEQISFLKKHKIKKVLVKEGIPFVPAFLAAFLVTVFIGNFIFLF